MRLGFIGLGKMGHNVVLNLMEKGNEVIAYNRSPDKTMAVVRNGATGAYSVHELVGKLPKPRTIIIMVTAGNPVDEVLSQLLNLLSKGDVVIEAGNSYFEDSIRRCGLCKKKGVHFLDVGTSGGLEGARHGASLMVGGDFSAFRRLERLFSDIAVKGGYAYMGPSGAGHFVKMVHNGIEYAIEEAYGEGFEVLQKSVYKLEFAKIASVWNHGSVVRSFLLEKALIAFVKDPKLKKFRGIIGGGETGRWTLNAAIREGVEMETLRHSLEKREESYRKQSFSTKVVSAMRWEFGAHEEPKKKR